MKYQVNKITDDFHEITIETNKYIVKLLNNAGTIKEISSIDKNGRMEAITLTYSDDRQYLDADKYGAFGLNVLRNAGRIENASFILNGQKTNLTVNNNLHNLHSGGSKSTKRIWHYEINNKEDSIQVIFNSTIPSKEDGFPGELTANIIYEFKNNEFTLNYICNADEDTICNITNHSYFNLSGNLKNTIEKHELGNDFEDVMSVNDEIIINGKKEFNLLHNEGEWVNVDTLLENDFFKAGCGLDNPFTLKDNTLRLKDSQSGRMLQIETSYPSVVLYSSNFPFGKKYNNSTQETKYIALAIEPQFLPNDINISGNDSKTILRKNKTYDHFIKYKFSVI